MAGTNIYGEMIRAQLQTSASDLSGPVTGLIYFNTTSVFPKWYNGSAWKTGVDSDSTQDLSNKSLISSLTFFKSSTGTNRRMQVDLEGATDSTTATLDFNQTAARTYTFPDASLTLLGEANSATVTNKVVSQCDIDGGTASNTSRITLPKDTTSNLSALTRKQGTIVYDTSVNKPYYDDGSTLKAIGSGSGGGGGKNYAADFADGSNVGTVGSGNVTDTGNRSTGTMAAWQSTNTANISISSSSSSPLREGSSYLTTGSGNSSTGATFLESIAWNLDNVDLGKPMLVQFDIADSTTSTDWDACIVRYNSSGTYQEKIAIAGTASTATFPSAILPTGTTTFRGFFIPSNTQTDYYAIRFRRLAGTVNIKLDTLQIGPQSVITGAAMTDWQSFTPSYGGLTSTSLNTGWWRRVGDSMEIFTVATASGAVGTTITLTIPNNLTIDTSKTQTLSTVTFGNAYAYDTSTTNCFTGTVAYVSTTTVDISQNSGTFDKWAPSVPMTWATGDRLSMNFRVPISQWSSNVTLADRAVEVYASNSSTSSSADTSAFVSGIQGSTGILGTTSLAASGLATKKRIQFDTPILPTDKMFVEYQKSSTQPWYEVGTVVDASYNSVDRYHVDVSQSYGIGIDVTSISGTQVDVVFGRYPAAQGTASYGATTTPWDNAQYSGSRWRVRKVSGVGAAVGYPIAPANIALINTTDNYSGNTKMGLMVYAHGGSYNGGLAPTITYVTGGGSLSSITRSCFIPYQLADGTWRMKYNFRAVVSSTARTVLRLNVAGVTTKNTSNYIQIAVGSQTNVSPVVGSSYWEIGSGDVNIEHSSATATGYSFAGDIELDSKPTWAY